MDTYIVPNEEYTYIPIARVIYHSQELFADSLFIAGYRLIRDIISVSEILKRAKIHMLGVSLFPNSRTSWYTRHVSSSTLLLLLP